MEAEVGTPINYNPDDFMRKEEDHQPDEQQPEPENNEQYYFPPPQPYYEPYPPVSYTHLTLPTILLV